MLMSVINLQPISVDAFLKFAVRQLFTPKPLIPVAFFLTHFLQAVVVLIVKLSLFAAQGQN